MSVVEVWMVQHSFWWSVGVALLVTAGCECGAVVGVDPPPAPRDVVDECGNGLDDDGDGAIDEDCFCGPRETQGCFPVGALGACGPGTQACDVAGTTEWGRWGTCEDAPAPTDEACDGAVDDDCDGTIDEGCACDGDAVRPCGASDVGACRLGSQACVDGVWRGCDGAVLPTAERCDNGEDDDCDGTVDDPTVCDCRPEPELCDDGVDNDCDGEIDEPGACDPTCVPASEACGNGVDDDCDARVDEGVPEVCGDGIDQDCDGEDSACPTDGGVDGGSPDAGGCPGGVCPVPCDGPAWQVVSRAIVPGSETAFRGFHVSEDGRRVMFPGGIVSSDGSASLGALRTDLRLGRRNAAVSVGADDYLHVSPGDGTAGVLHIDAAGTVRTLGPLERERLHWNGPYIATSVMSGGTTEPAVVFNLPNSFGEAQWPFGFLTSDGSLHRFATLSTGGEEYEVIARDGDRLHGYRPMRAGEIDNSCASNVGQQRGETICAIEWVIAPVATPATAEQVVRFTVPLPGWDLTRPFAFANDTGYLISSDFTSGPTDREGISAIQRDGSIREIWSGGDIYVLAWTADAVFVRQDDAPHELARIDLTTGTYTAIPYPDYFATTRPSYTVVNEATGCLYTVFRENGRVDADALLARRALP